MGTKSMPSGFICPSMIGQVRGFEVTPILNCNLMRVSRPYAWADPRALIFFS